MTEIQNTQCYISNSNVDAVWTQSLKPLWYRYTVGEDFLSGIMGRKVEGCIHTECLDMAAVCMGCVHIQIQMPGRLHSRTYVSVRVRDLNLFRATLFAISSRSFLRQTGMPLFLI